MSQSSVILIA